jgi:hypothetical protein
MNYYSFNSYLKEKYGTRLRKISLNAGFSCPNKESGQGRCIYCNELGFSRFAGRDVSLREQIERSMVVLKEKGVEKFIAYFQNATNTNAEPGKLKTAYDIIKEYPEIVALCISTRPDCVDDEKLDLIASYTGSYEVWMEYGLQTIHDRTLKAVNRGHTFEQSVIAIEKTARRSIKTGVHIILGLPGESDEDMIATAKKISTMPVSGVKLHVLHVLRDTELERMYRENKIKLLERDEYVGIACSFLENLKPDCVILRMVSDARKEYLIAPWWINDKLSVIDQIDREFEIRGTRQGSKVRV